MNRVSRASLIVLVPTRNEGWIMERFLRITTRFADEIIVADQGSTGDTREVCRRFPQVRLIDNPDRDYDELARQRLLIAAARHHHPGPRVLLALDADELLTADSITTPAWQEVREAPPGTTLFFDKPDALFGADRCRVSAGGFPLGFADDGREHHGLVMHSTRVPLADQPHRRHVPDIKFLHLGMLREREFMARQRYYAVLENLKATKSWRQRVNFYSPALQRARLRKVAQPLPKAWTAGWTAEGIDVFAHTSSDDSGFNHAILEAFATHGPKRFHGDDLWDVNWEELRRRLRPQDPPIPPPPFAYRCATGALRLAYLVRLAGSRRVG